MFRDFDIGIFGRGGSLLQLLEETLKGRLGVIDHGLLFRLLTVESLFEEPLLVEGLRRRLDPAARHRTT
jgi:hypothetical protein